MLTSPYLSCAVCPKSGCSTPGYLSQGQNGGKIHFPCPAALALSLFLSFDAVQDTVVVLGHKWTPLAHVHFLISRLESKGLFFGLMDLQNATTVAEKIVLFLSVQERNYILLHCNFLPCFSSSIMFSSFHLCFCIIQGIKIQIIF